MGDFYYLLKCMDHYKASDIDDCIHPNDAMNNEWYFGVGESAVYNIAAGYLASHLGVVNRVLDLPCGHGRVLRHLIRFFPDAAIDACDLDSDGVRFCQERFHAYPIYSREDLTEVEFPHRYDVIWVGSLFTHLDRQRVRRWMLHLARALTPLGIIVATFHGRWSEHAHTVAPYITADRWDHILSGYQATGFGYSDYEGHGHSFISGSYGVSLAKPEAVVCDVAGIPDTRIYMYQERGWADHQDVIVFGKPAFDEPWLDTAGKSAPTRSV